ncbi:unnamed protein product [Darwinula stevensoni]|uniref:RRM domain-containing protein n=1 Tax=Darwinula stevensoni TaxID=69355 RepID=A0A7R8XB86_9CRUS|nr:unnamed protein product [Darwinula stevensoni]CAG0886219.1 unnamed protein product [Darwinula stevensoni]
MGLDVSGFYVNMASQGKKAKKVKGKTVALTEFLADNNEDPGDGRAVVHVPKKSYSWADEVDDDDVLNTERVVLPTAPKASRGPDVDPDRIPSEPPFTVRVSNLSYDLDLEDIQKFFKELKVADIRLPRENGDSGRLKGYGFIDFEDQQSLLEALAMNELALKNRKVRIDLAGFDDRSGGGMGGRRGDRDRDRDRDRGDDRTLGDWRSARDEERGPPPPTQSYRNAWSLVLNPQVLIENVVMEETEDLKGMDGMVVIVPSTDEIEGLTGIGTVALIETEALIETAVLTGTVALMEFVTVALGTGIVIEVLGTGTGTVIEALEIETGTVIEALGTGTVIDAQTEGLRVEVEVLRAEVEVSRAEVEGLRVEVGGLRVEAEGLEAVAKKMTVAFPGNGIGDSVIEGLTEVGEHEEKTQRGIETKMKKVDPHQEALSLVEGNRERPRLKLQPRTAPIEEVGTPATASTTIFGGAKPVDTAAREREIEQRLLRENVNSDHPAGPGSEAGRSPKARSQSPPLPSQVQRKTDSSKPSHDHDRDHGERDTESPSGEVRKAPPPQRKGEEGRGNRKMEKGGSTSRPSRSPKEYEPAPPPNYEMANKFAGLQVEDVEDDGENVGLTANERALDALDVFLVLVFSSLCWVSRPFEQIVRSELIRVISILSPCSQKVSRTLKSPFLASPGSSVDLELLLRYRYMGNILMELRDLSFKISPHSVSSIPQFAFDLDQAGAVGGGGSGGGWIPRPEQRVMCPPGLEYLTMVDQLLIQQKVELLEAFTGFETANKYSVKNSMGQRVYVAAEDSDCCTRNICGPIRPFGMKIFDNHKKEVMHLYRPLMCDSCWFPCCLQELEVSAPPGQLIGMVQQEWSILTPEFRIVDAVGNKLAHISGPFCTFSLCGDVEFQVFYPLLPRFRQRVRVRIQVKAVDGMTIGKISKQWSGLVKEAFTDADNFGVSFPLELDVNLKALILAATFLIDFMFFEKKGNKENDGLGMF